MQDRYIGAAEVAEHIGVRQQSVYVMRHRKQLPPAVRIGGRLRWKLSDLDAWLDAQKEEETA